MLDVAQCITYIDATKLLFSCLKKRNVVLILYNIGVVVNGHFRSGSL